MRIIRGGVIGTAKVVKKLEASNSSHRMETALEREEGLSQTDDCSVSWRQDHRQEDQRSESWEDIWNQSLHGLAETGKGVGRFTKAYLSSPLYFSLGLAQGFQ